MEISNDISSHLLDFGSRFKRHYVVDDNSLEKINSILHKAPQFSLICGHQVIEKIQRLRIVKDIHYDFVKNEEFMDFSRLEIIFKENT